MTQTSLFSAQNCDSVVGVALFVTGVVRVQSFIFIYCNTIILFCLLMNDVYFFFTNRMS